MKNNKFIKRIASSLVVMGISTLANSNSWAENLKIGVVGPYTGEMSNYDISSKNGVTLAVMYFNAVRFLNHSLRLFSKTTTVIKLRPLK